jgi:ubiquitin carboxyl-terminal hydrolase 34
VSSYNTHYHHSELGPQLFQKHLFPEFHEEDIKLITPKIPLLNTTTRRTMAETIFFLVKDDEQQYKRILELLGHLVLYDPQGDRKTFHLHSIYFSICILTVLENYVYDLSNQFERNKVIRSATGYVGLKNLSNTCYLNSLMTQLFMNVPFREFMLSATIKDESSQRLLDETKKAFANMQNSLKRYFDPVGLASSIRTYDEGNIDVTVQMDVDEFYNLIFDRWEGQILAPEAKRKFRSLYGGQIVQQVKSKECEHVSERLEDFSAIQCDIKGKTSLQESLQAYVDGEVMEGGK